MRLRHNSVLALVVVSVGFSALCVLTSCKPSVELQEGTYVCAEASECPRDWFCRAPELLGGGFCYKDSSVCGDGILNESAGEVCDDGNDANCDDCTRECVPSTGDAALAMLKLVPTGNVNVGRFEPTFDPEVDVYAFSVPSSETEAQLTVRTQDAGASVDVTFDGDPVSLDAMGQAQLTLPSVATVLQVLVTSSDCNASQTATVTLSRFHQTDALYADDGILGDELGNAISLSGDGTLLAVGAVGRSNGAGGAYVFARDGEGRWNQEALLLSGNPGSGDEFGHSITLSGDGTHLVVGAPKEDAAPSLMNSGAAYVFVRDGNNWTQADYLKATDASEDAYFGESVAVSNDGARVVVGAPDAQVAMLMDSGAVYVFEKNGSSWGQATRIVANMPTSSSGSTDNFGEYLALSRDGTCLVALVHGSEKAEVFKHNGTGWAFETPLLPDGGRSIFDGRLSISNDGTRIALGTHRVNGESGAAYVFSKTGNNWSQIRVAASNGGPGDHFGDSIALSGDGLHLAVGASLEDAMDATTPGDDSATNSGAVYVFGYDGSNWVQRRYLKTRSVGSEDLFGQSVSLDNDGGVLAVGAGFAPNASSLDSGAAYIFE